MKVDIIQHQLGFGRGARNGTGMPTILKTRPKSTQLASKSWKVARKRYQTTADLEEGAAYATITRRHNLIWGISVHVSDKIGIGATKVYDVFARLEVKAGKHVEHSSLRFVCRVLWTASPPASRRHYGCC